jgi:hypothetical protein
MSRNRAILKRYYSALGHKDADELRSSIEEDPAARTTHSADTRFVSRPAGYASSRISRSRCQGSAGTGVNDHPEPRQHQVTPFCPASPGTRQRLVPDLERARSLARRISGGCLRQRMT